MTADSTPERLGRRRIGRSELNIGPLMMGGNLFGWSLDDRCTVTLLDTFVDAGFNAIDTADIYSQWVEGHEGGESERAIGRWLKQGGRRDRVIIATKVGALPPDPGSSKPTFGRQGWRRDLSAAHLVAAAEGSLRRLQTDYIDLYQTHAADPDIPLGETLEALEQLVRSGKVRAIGASNHGADEMAQALDTSAGSNLPRYESLQICYNLRDRAGFEGALQALSVERDIGVLCYSALARGFLSGRFRVPADAASHHWNKRITGDLDQRGHRILAALDQVAQEQQATLSQIALAWLLMQPGVTAPVVSLSNLDELREAIGSVDMVLTPAQVERLTALPATEVMANDA